MYIDIYIYIYLARQIKITAGMVVLWFFFLSFSFLLSNFSLKNKLNQSKVKEKKFVIIFGFIAKNKK